MKPTLGRIVHHVQSDGAIRPAMVTGVYADDRVDLDVFLRREDVRISLVTGEDGYGVSIPRPGNHRERYPALVPFDPGTDTDAGEKGTTGVDTIVFKPNSWHWPPKA